MHDEGVIPIDAELNELSDRVIGAAIEVHRALGPGFQELTYQRAMLIELYRREIRVESEVPITLKYKDEQIGNGRIDLLVEGRLVVELKSAEANPKKYRKQVVVYLKATGLRLGLVINFEADLLKEGICRVAN